jgi:glc operon protein GlcG
MKIGIHPTTAVAAIALLGALGTVGSAAGATKPYLTLDGAKVIAAAAESEARRLGAPSGAIAIVDDGGHLLALERLDNTFPAAATVAVEKARTAATFRRPTANFEDAIKGGRLALLGVDVMTPLEGGIPITIEGQVVGAIGVSGAASAQQDDDIAKGTVAAWDKMGAMAGNTGSSGAAGAAGADPAPVTYFRADSVAKSFAQGAVLFDHGTNYMIHTSRRVMPGMAEVHTKDTDLIYVLEGSATFVTGGTVVAGASTAPDEIRGSQIDGGETRLLSKGDVIVVPAGTPHWFKEVRGPFLYYTIKVR